VLTGCKKGEGIISAIRSMGPAVVAMDEVTDEADCQALIQAAWCGVRVIATAHALSIFDLQKRSVYRPLLDSDIFDRILILQQDKSWRLERMRHDN
jgi:stage III sporulation protein AA